MLIDNDLGIDWSTPKVITCVKRHHIRPSSGTTKRDSMIFYKHSTPSGSINGDKKSLKRCGYTVGSIRAESLAFTVIAFPWTKDFRFCLAAVFTILLAIFTPCVKSGPNIADSSVCIFYASGS